jgi:hypothetical protein
MPTSALLAARCRLSLLLTGGLGGHGSERPEVKLCIGRGMLDRLADAGAGQLASAMSSWFERGHTTRLDA